MSNPFAVVPCDFIVYTTVLCIEENVLKHYFLRSKTFHFSCGLKLSRAVYSRFEHLVEKPF